MGTNNNDGTKPTKGTFTNDATGKPMFAGCHWSMGWRLPNEGESVLGRFIMNVDVLPTEDGPKKVPGGWVIVTHLRVWKEEGNPVSIEYIDDGKTRDLRLINLFNAIPSQIKEMARYLQDIGVTVKPTLEQYDKAWADIQALSEKGTPPREAKKIVKHTFQEQFGIDQGRRFDQAMYRRGYVDLLQNAT